MPDPTDGMVTIRHVPGSTRTAYNRIYLDQGIRHADRFSDRVLGWMDARAGDRLLDVACGEGQLVRRAREWGLQGHGVDLSDAALSAARSGSDRGAGWGVADGERLPFEDGAFDLVTNMGSLEHYENPVRGAAEMARVTRTEGRVCLHVPNTYGLRWAVSHAWRHGDVPDDGQPIQRYGTRRQWEALLAAGSLEVIEVQGLEEMADGAGGIDDWFGLLRHPSRVLVPLSGLVPVNMASMLLFLCRPVR